MMNNCVSCGYPIPENQRVCSMCYGNLAYGRDSYFQQWLDEQLHAQQEQRQQKEQQEVQ